MSEVTKILREIRAGNEQCAVQEMPPEQLLAIDEALELLTKEDPIAASLVKLRYFVGMSMSETATTTGIPLGTAESLWTYARTWLRREVRKQRLPP